VCGPKESCPEERNPATLCPQGCYEVAFRVDDVTAAAAPPPAAPPLFVRGDGTAPGTLVNGQPATTLPWWIGPFTRSGPDQGEENVTIAAVLGRLLGLTRR
jgi:hypothetical protein